MIFISEIPIYINRKSLVTRFVFMLKACELKVVDATSVMRQNTDVI